MLTLTVLVATLAAGGCNRSRTDSQVPSGRPAFAEMQQNPADPRVVAYVAWLQRNGVTLENIGGGAWKVVSPRNSDKYDVAFHLGSFPEGTTEARMRAAANEGALAYLVNAPAQLATSHAGLIGYEQEPRSRTDDDFPKLNGVPVTKAVEQLFLKYKGK